MENLRVSTLTLACLTLKREDFSLPAETRWTVACKEKQNNQSKRYSSYDVMRAYSETLPTENDVGQATVTA